MSKRLSKVEKILRIVEALAKEAEPLLYPYSKLSREIRRFPHSYLSEALYDLKRTGYLEEVEIKGRKTLKFTLKGKLKIWRPGIERKWDGQWRLLAFDIEEVKRKNRDLLRAKLKLLGFKQLQKSLWISPYDASTEIEELIDLLDLEDNIQYFLTKAITGEENLKLLFQLDKSKEEKKNNPSS